MASGGRTVGQCLHGVALLARRVQHQNSPNFMVFGPFVRAEHAFWGVFRVSEAFCHKTYVESNSAIHVAIPWYTMPLSHNTLNTMVRN